MTEHSKEVNAADNLEGPFQLMKHFFTYKNIHDRTPWDVNHLGVIDVGFNFLKFQLAPNFLQKQNLVFKQGTFISRKFPPSL